MTRLGLANLFHIGEVAHTSGCQLRGNQVCFRDDEYSQAALWVDDSLNTVFPCLVKFHAVDSGKDIDGDGWLSEADELLWVSKIVLVDIRKRGSEICERRIGRFRIRRVCLDEDVQVFGRAGLRMKGDRVTANNEILNSLW